MASFPHDMHWRWAIPLSIGSYLSFATARCCTFSFQNFWLFGFFFLRSRSFFPVGEKCKSWEGGRRGGGGMYDFAFWKLGKVVSICKGVLFGGGKNKKIRDIWGEGLGSSTVIFFPFLIGMGCSDQDKHRGSRTLFPPIDGRLPCSGGGSTNSCLRGGGIYNSFSFCVFQLFFFFFLFFFSRSIYF